MFTNSAAALPCELGPDGQMKQPASRQQAWTPAKSVVMWRQRIAAQRMQKQQVSNADRHPPAACSLLMNMAQCWSVMSFSHFNLSLQPQAFD